MPAASHGHYKTWGVNSNPKCLATVWSHCTLCLLIKEFKNGFWRKLKDTFIQVWEWKQQGTQELELLAAVGRRGREKTGREEVRLSELSMCLGNCICGAAFRAGKGIRETAVPSTFLPHLWCLLFLALGCPVGYKRQYFPCIVGCFQSSVGKKKTCCLYQRLLMNRASVKEVRDHPTCYLHHRFSPCRCSHVSEFPAWKASLPT